MVFSDRTDVVLADIESRGRAVQRVVYYLRRPDSDGAFMLRQFPMQDTQH